LWLFFYLLILFFRKSYSHFFKMSFIWRFTFLASLLLRTTTVWKWFTIISSAFTFVARISRRGLSSNWPFLLDACWSVHNTFCCHTILNFGNVSKSICWFWSLRFSINFSSNYELVKAIVFHMIMGSSFILAVNESLNNTWM